MRRFVLVPKGNFARSLCPDCPGSTPSSRSDGAKCSLPAWVPRRVITKSTNIHLAPCLFSQPLPSFAKFVVAVCYTNRFRLSFLGRLSSWLPPGLTTVTPSLEAASPATLHTLKVFSKSVAASYRTLNRSPSSLVIQDALLYRSRNCSCFLRSRMCSIEFMGQLDAWSASDYNRHDDSSARQ